MLIVVSWVTLKILTLSSSPDRVFVKLLFLTEVFGLVMCPSSEQIKVSLRKKSI